MADEGDRGASGRTAHRRQYVREEDLVLLCGRLNELGASYVVVGGFAIIYGGLARTTTDIDLVLATDLENEALVYRALEVFPDKAVRELKPGEVAQYVVVRVADEVLTRIAGEPLPDLLGRRVAGRADPVRLAAPALADEIPHASPQR